MKYIIIFVYTAINIFLLILNWNLFTSIIIMDFGFSMVTIAPLILIQVLGLLALVVFAILDGFKDLKREVIILELQQKILVLEKDTEIKTLKNKTNSKIEQPKVGEVVAKVVK